MKPLYMVAPWKRRLSSRATKWLALASLLVLIITSLGVTRLAVRAASGLVLEYANGNTAATTNTPRALFRIVNTTGASVALSTLTIRYWFTRDGSQTQQLWCDYAVAGCGNIAGSFVNLTTTTSTADTSIQVSFSSAAGSIATNANSGEIQLRFNKSDWSNYNQANDYSWNQNQTSYASWSQVTLYQNGQLVWGTEPGGSTTPTATSTTQISPTATPTSRVTPTMTPTPGVTPTPTSSLTPTPTAGISCSGAIFCDNFESQTGSTPSGAWQVSFPNCQGTGTVSVDRTLAHSGSTSIRVDGRAGYCNHVFFGIPGAFNAAGTDVYVRFFIRHTTALPTGHVTFTAMLDTNDTNHDLRMGGQNGALQWNRSSDDATLPAQSPAGVALSMPLPTNQWSCVQFEVNEAQGTMRTWLNSNEVAGLHLDQVATQDIDAQWLSRANWRPALADLRFGWESYSDGDDTLWFDDVAIASQQLSCSV